MLHTKKRLLLALFAWLMFSNTCLQAKDINFSTTEVAKGIYMLQGVGGFTGGNIAVSIGQDGVVMIDDSMPAFLTQLNKTLKKLTDKPIDFLINTHIHGDHIGNNESFGASGVHIVAHKNMRIQLLKKNAKSAKPGKDKSLPVITFNHEINFHLNDDQVDIFHLANAHTNGDAGIYFSRANVFHAGDVFFNGMFPYIDLGSGGSVNGYIAAQKKILSMVNSKTKIIPGHGPLATKKDLMQSVEMLQEAKSIIEALVNAGKTEDQVLKLNPLSKYDKKWSWNFITTEKMTRQVYKSLKNNTYNDLTMSSDHHH